MRRFCQPVWEKKELCADGFAGGRIAANDVCFYSIAKHTGSSLMLDFVDWATETEQQPEYQQFARLKETRIFAPLLSALVAWCCKYFLYFGNAYGINCVALVRP